MSVPWKVPMTAAEAKLVERLRPVVPVLETERLRLRAPVLEDFESYRAIACTARGQYIGGPMTEEEAWFDFTGMIATWLLRGHGVWTAERKGEGERLGFVLIGCEPGDREHELGFLFLEHAEGQGYATEAAIAAKNFAFQTLELGSLVSYIAEPNTRSIRLAERLGATRDLTAELDLDPGDRVYRYSRS